MSRLLQVIILHSTYRRTNSQAENIVTIRLCCESSPCLSDKNVAIWKTFLLLGLLLNICCCLILTFICGYDSAKLLTSIKFRRSYSQVWTARVHVPQPKCIFLLPGDVRSVRTH